jgi:hypothetical protein
MRRLPFVRLIDIRTYPDSKLISWIMSKAKLRGADGILGDNIPATNDTLNTPVYQVQKNIEAVYDLTALSGLRIDAPTENRFTYFATDLNIPIWWNSVTEVWVNSQGTIQPLETVVDTTPPTFSLSPIQTSYTITEGSAFVVPVLTLTDNVDGVSTPSPTINTVDINTAGSYVVTWSNLSDVAGNTITDVTITVEVETVVDMYGFNVWQSFNNWG